ncbi:MAG: hypothetical protein ABIO19_09580 [Burkholderiaceae bacterium]
MKLPAKLLIGLGFMTAVLSTPFVQADTGSDLLFNAKIAQLQCEIRVRNKLADELVQFQLAHGYSANTSEALARQGKTMLARADDDAFTNEMKNLQRTLKLYESMECA